MGLTSTIRLAVAKPWRAGISNSTSLVHRPWKHKGRPRRVPGPPHQRDESASGNREWRVTRPRIGDTEVSPIRVASVSRRRTPDRGVQRPEQDAESRAEALHPPLTVSFSWFASVCGCLRLFTPKPRPGLRSNVDHIARPLGLGAYVCMPPHPIPPFGAGNPPFAGVPPILSGLASESNLYVIQKPAVR